MRIILPRTEHQSSWNCSKSRFEGLALNTPFAGLFCHLYQHQHRNQHHECGFLPTFNKTRTLAISGSNPLRPKTLMTRI